jgi:hypothetical protein
MTPISRHHGVPQFPRYLNKPDGTEVIYRLYDVFLGQSDQALEGPKRWDMLGQPQSVHDFKQVV